MKILIVVEKPSIVKTLEQCLNNHKNEIEHSFEFTTFIPTFHINNHFLSYRTDENLNIYCRRELQSDTKWLQLEKVEIPIGTFFQYIRPFKKVNSADYDKIIFMPDYDTDGIFGMQKFAEMNQIKNADFYKYLDLTEASLLPVFKLEGLEKFNDVFEETYQASKKNNFEADYPRKVDIEKLRKKIGWTRKQFSDYFNIPYRTVENWEFFENQMPEYWYDLIIYKLKNEKIL